MDMKSSPPAALALLADGTRWRLLRVLARDRLNVGELTRVLGLAQSGVSRHLALLLRGGFVEEERRGGFTYAGLAVTAPAGLGRLWAGLRDELRGAPDLHGDDARLAQAQGDREEAGEPPSGAPPGEPGRSWAAWSQALGRLLPAWDVVHLGAGDGALTDEVARFARQVTAVRAPGGGARAPRPRAGRVRSLTAPLAATGLPGSAFDLVLLAQALPREADPPSVLAEAARLLRPGGRVLVLDLLPHDQRWVLERWGHRRLGLAPRTLARWLTAAGLVRVGTGPAGRRRGQPFVVLIGSGERPQEVRR